MATNPNTVEFSPNQNFSLQWEKVLNIISSSRMIQKPSNRPDSHLCDLHLEDDDNDNDVFVSMEEGFPLDDAEQPRIEVSILQAKSQNEQTLMPKLKDSRLSVILLDQGLFTVYKRLFLLCLAINIMALVFGATGHFPYATQNSTLFSIGNLFALTLCRNEAFLRITFYLAVKIFGPRWVPLPLKTTITSLLQSLGGIHSGCGSCIVWLMYSLIITFKNRENTSNEIIIVASIILALLLISALAAFPLVRHLHHNVFERTHRFSGWAALALLWCFVYFTISYDLKTKSYEKKYIFLKLVKRQEFWLTCGGTMLIITPWLTVRRVPVKISAPSNHASLIKFGGGVKAGLLGRISPSPFSEWHAFGIISDGEKDHMMLAGAVGDFTRSLVSSRPSHLWVRNVHFAGLPYLVNMYERVLLVATGSGICVFLSFLLQPSRADVCLLWVAKGIEENFGKEIKGWVSGHPKHKVIMHDTAIFGRPDVSKMSVDVAKNWGAEVVIVTSNPEGSRDVVNACKSVGIPAFGPIWDS